MTKIGRNDPCPCGSGKKYKRCCGSETHVGTVDDIEPAAGNSALLDRRAHERTLADIDRILSDQEFGSIEDANVFLQTALLGGTLEREPATPLEEAQELMYDAWEEPSRWQRAGIAKQALAISPDCADAYVLLAEETTRTPKERRDLFAQGVAAGERALGERTFREEAGYFWGMFETRPYMRARFGLAQSLWEMGERREAIEHYEDMIRLNPGDNQGVRYILLPALLSLGDHTRVADLLARYKDDIAAAWAYGRALHHFQTGGDTPSARRTLGAAKRANPHVPAYLSGEKPLPEILPDVMGIGDEREGIICASQQMEAWQRTPNALAWLRKNT